MIRFPRKPRSLLSKLVISHLVVVTISLVVIGLFLIYLIENYFFDAREWELAGQTRDAALLIGEDLTENDLNAVAKTAETLAYSLNAKIRVLDEEQGSIITIDPDAAEGSIEKIKVEGVGLEQREIEHIFKGNMLTKKVFGPELKRLLVAAPIIYKELDNQKSETLPPEERVIGAITLSAPLRGMEETIAHISRLILYSGAIGFFIASVIAFSLSNKLTRPLQKINRAALDMAGGNFNCKIDEESDDEIGSLVKTFNYSVEQVQRNIEEQKRLETLRRNLVANVSHELKAPLASIRGFSELMLDDVISESDKTKYLQVILDNSVHLSRLVDDLFTLSRLESGQLHIDKELIALRSLARWSFDSVAPRGEAKGVIMKLELPPSLPPLYGDRHRLHEVLVNLLDNAIKFTPTGGIVSLNIRENKAGIIIEVKDSGCGIPDEELPLIFERFYMVDKARRYRGKGSGLGLAISKQLVELHGGKLEVESKVGMGSLFRITLWLEPAPG